LHANLVPIFITLKDVAETEQCLSLFDYIHQEFSTYGIDEKTAVEEILHQGKALVLLDGLDEVRTMAARTIQEIRNFTATFPRNHFVITSRIVT
ncbi:NACHT domain-containing protein, partial [Klebsiella pneumoniae]|uniref:NACHT domain-containing protein n=1 Tax=Klebsiella pneumoniae TaxID=573 RepID=UPI001BE0EC75